VKASGFFDVAPEEVARLVLVRHGRTAFNDQGRLLGTTDDPLDAEGERQAGRAAERLVGMGIAAIECSPLSRARRTAEVIAARLGIAAVEVEPDLLEYDFGVLSDVTLAALRERDPALHAHVQAWLEMGPEPTMARPVVPRAETMEHLAARVHRFTAKVVARYQGRVALAVAHAGLMRAMLTLWAGGTLDRRLPFRIDNASVSVVDFHRGVPCIRLFNDVGHLGGQLSLGRPSLL
jgi:broad specificity phosphatase PhoE